MAKYSAPGKVFLLGEYAVLAGRTAAVAALPPRFRLEPGRATYAEGSPAARLLAAAGESSGLPVRDPHQGTGGFGASTAAFALTYRALADARGWPLSAEAVWGRYRELHSSEAVPPSGADLFTQWAGGVVAFDPLVPSRSTRIAPRRRLDVLVLSASRQPGRKVATYEHLSRLADGDGPPTRFLGLDAPLERGLAALRNGDAHALGRAFTDYADALRALGLELAATTEDRATLSRLPGVAGVKGTGALQADAIVVALSPDAAGGARRSILSAARARGLVPVFEGWPAEEGVRCES